MHKRGWCRPKVQSKKTIKLSRGVRKGSRVRLHLQAVSESGHLQDGANSTFSSADNLRFNACTNMDWCSECMNLMSNMFLDHRCQSTPDLNHYCFNTWNIWNFNTFNTYKYRNSFSKWIYSCAAFFFLEKKTLHHLHSLQKIRSLSPFFNMLKESEEFR